MTVPIVKVAVDVMGGDNAPDAILHGVKEALAMMGWCDPIIRSPLYRMEEPNLERLRKAMTDLGII